LGCTTWRRLKARSWRVSADARLAASQQHLGIAADDREQVVEVVRHAASQAAEGFHLLGLAELRFQVLALGDVADDAGDAPAFVGLHRAQVHFGEELSAVLAPCVQLFGPRAGAPRARPAGRVEAPVRLTGTLGQ
jgi:hypothetical protein